MGVVGSTITMSPSSMPEPASAGAHSAEDEQLDKVLPPSRQT